MISYIVATHDPTVLDAKLRASLELGEGDELIVVTDAPSIAAAYNEGQARATQPIRCYVHHDVQVLDSARLRHELVAACRPGVGIVGVIGSREAVMPWWEAPTKLGSVGDARLGMLAYGEGGDCAYLDGLLLATSQLLVWDEGYTGWHLYDHDVCRQMLAAGLRNRCLSDGATLVRHDTTSPRALASLDGWDEAVTRFRRKWQESGIERPAASSGDLAAAAPSPLPTGDELARTIRAFRVVVERQPENARAVNTLAHLCMPGPNYLEVLRRIHALTDPRTYLEIGVAGGATLRLAHRARVAVGIDPGEAPAELPRNARFERMRSDDFFARNERREIFGEPVDLAFIDGMHWFEYALRDFIHVERWCAPDSRILLHDCLPVSRGAAERVPRSAFWTGDTWKLLACLVAHRPDLRIRTIPTPPAGLVVVSGLDPESTTLDALDPSLIAEYADLDPPTELDAWPTGIGLVTNDEDGWREALGLPRDAHSRTSARPAPGRQEIAVEAFGVAVRLRGPAELLSAAVHRLPPGSRPTDPRRECRTYVLAGDRGFTLEAVGESSRSFASADDLLAALEDDVSRHVAEQSPAAIFVHSGVVTIGGRALLVCGPSGSGKTTLVAALVRAGAVYYSDEYAAIDHSGRVHPYARPLGLRTADGRPLARRRVEEIGGRSGEEPAEIEAILLVHYEPDGETALREIGDAEATVRVLANTLCAQRRPAEAIAVIARAVSRARVLFGTRDDVESFVERAVSRIGRGRGNAGIRQEEAHDGH